MTKISSSDDNNSFSKELDEFRQEWKAEVRKKEKKSRQQSVSALPSLDAGVGSSSKPRLSSSHPESMSTTATDSAEKEMPLPYGNVKNGNKPRNTTTQANVVSLDHLRKFVASGHSSALELYEQAVRNEQKERFNEALIYYRAAFKADENVERLYRSKELELLNSSQQQQQIMGNDKATEKTKDDEDEDDLDFKFTTTLSLQDYYHPSTSAPQEGMFDLTSTDTFKQGLLASFLANPFDIQQYWNDNSPIKINSTSETAQTTTAHKDDGEKEISENENGDKTNDAAFILAHNPDDIISTSPFEMYPHDPSLPMYFSRLPPECLLCILNHLVHPNNSTSHPHVTYIERFARVSRLARLLSLQVSIWSFMCEHVFQPPYQISNNDSASLLAAKHYTGDWRRMWIERPRVRSDGVYIAKIIYLRPGVAESHSLFITYYRYLRFYSTGVVVSLVSAIPPDDIVRNLDLDLRIKGLAVGSWKLRRNKIICFDLEDPARRKGDNKYSFVMEAILKSTCRGRMNRMEIHKVSSYNRIDEELIDIPLANETHRAFVFSKVYAYEGR